MAPPGPLAELGRPLAGEPEELAMRPPNPKAKSSTLIIVAVAVLGAAPGDNPPAPGLAATADAGRSNDGLEVTARWAEPATREPPIARYIEITIHNRGERQAYIGWSNEGASRYDFLVERRATPGAEPEPVPPTAAFLAFHQTFDGSSWPIYINPGCSTSRRFRVDELFDLSQAGSYAVVATFRDPMGERLPKTFREADEVRAGRLHLPSGRLLRAKLPPVSWSSQHANHPRP